MLNPYGAAAIGSGFVAHAMFPGEEPILIHPGHGGLIRRLGGAFEVVWATGRNEQANTRLAPLLDSDPAIGLTDELVVQALAWAAGLESAGPAPADPPGSGHAT